MKNTDVPASNSEFWMRVPGASPARGAELRRQGVRRRGLRDEDERRGVVLQPLPQRRGPVRRDEDHVLQPREVGAVVADVEPRDALAPGPQRRRQRRGEEPELRARERGGDRFDVRRLRRLEQPVRLVQHEQRALRGRGPRAEDFREAAGRRHEHLRRGTAGARHGARNGCRWLLLSVQAALS